MATGFNLQDEYAAAPSGGQGTSKDQSAQGLTLSADDVAQISALKAQGDMAGIGQYVAQLIP